MKLSKRNLDRLAREQEKLARGKPLISKFERKSLTAEEIHDRELSMSRQRTKSGIVTTR